MHAILPELARKDPALAARLKSEYADILAFVSRVDERERRSGGKITAAEIEELASQAKRHTDQLTPHLKQMAVEMNLKLPPKPTAGLRREGRATHVLRFRCYTDETPSCNRACEIPRRRRSSPR